MALITIEQPMNPLEASRKYHWITYDTKTQTLNIYLDHMMLSTLRMCEQKFVEEYVFNIRPKGHKAWSLVFGAWFHFCAELYYRHLKDHNGIAIDVGEWLRYGRTKW